MKNSSAICHLLSAVYRRNGQAAISFVFIIGTIMLSIGVAVAVIAMSFLNSGYGFKFSNAAMAIATAGAEDALLRLARNKDFSSTYSVPVNSYSANVAVTQNSPSSGQAKIISSATVFFQQRKIQVVVAVNGTTSEISVLSWQLLTL